MTQSPNSDRKTKGNTKVYVLITMVFFGLALLAGHLGEEARRFDLLGEPIGEERGVFIQDNEERFIGQIENYFYSDQIYGIDLEEPPGRIPLDPVASRRIFLLGLCSRMTSRRSLALIVSGLIDEHPEVRAESRSTLNWRVKEIGDPYVVTFCKDFPQACESK